MNSNLIVDRACNLDTDLTLLLKHFDNNKIMYVFSESTYGNTSGQNEHDLFVSGKDFKKMPDFAREFGTQNNLIPIQKLLCKNTLCLYFMSNDHKEGLNYLKIKFIHDYKIEGRFYISSEELLSNRVYMPEDKSWKLAGSYLFICCLLKNITSKYIGKDDFRKLWHYRKQAGLDIIQKLQKFLEKDSIELIFKSLDEKNIDYLNAMLNRLNKDLLNKTPKRINHIITDKINLLNAAFKPAGLVVGILGRDGSGKSTLADEIISSLGPYFNGTNTFKKFPSLLYKGEIFKKKEAYDFTKPHYHKQRDRFTSFLKLNLILIEFMFGYWLKVFPLKAKSHLVLYDRYFADLLADPHRYRIKGNQFIIKAFHYILPKPDMWIILDIPTNILLERKQELTYETSEKLRYKYLNLQQLLPNCFVLNNEEAINKTVNKASTFILKYMHQKVAVQK